MLPRRLGHTGLVDADVVVIGAGALGLSTALHCALAGRSVVVAERYTAGSQASGRAAGLFKSVQADELRTRLARRSIAKAVSFADWAGTGLAVARSGGFLIARTAQHAEYLRQELAQSRRWGADVREAEPAQLGGLSYYRPAGDHFALWCTEDVYIEEPASLIDAYLAACRRHGAVVIQNDPVVGIPVANGRVAGVEMASRPVRAPVVVDAAGAVTAGASVVTWAASRRSTPTSSGRSSVLNDGGWWRGSSGSGPVSNPPAISPPRAGRRYTAASTTLVIGSAGSTPGAGPVMSS